MFYLLYILISSKFALQWKISSLALAYNKIVYKPGGVNVKFPFQELTENSTENVLNYKSHQNETTNEAIELLLKSGMTD